MSTEFIIGTIIGLIGIIPIIIQAVKWVKKPKLSELMKRLVDNSLSTKTHRIVLRIRGRFFDSHRRDCILKPLSGPHYFIFKHYRIRVESWGQESRIRGTGTIIHTRERRGQRFCS